MLGLALGPQLHTWSQLEEERKNASKQDAYILSQAWQAILDALDTLYDICKDVKVDATTFSTLSHHSHSCPCHVPNACF